MIENEKIGLKVAVDKEEAFWQGLKIKVEQMIQDFKYEIIIQNTILKLIKRKLKKFEK